MIVNDGLIMASAWHIFDIAVLIFALIINHGWKSGNEMEVLIFLTEQILIDVDFSSLPCLILPDGKPVNMFTQNIVVSCSLGWV